MKVAEIQEALCRSWGLQNEEEKSAFFTRFDSLSILVSRVIKDIQVLPEGEVYRVVEFGCGDNPSMAVMMHAIMQVYNRKMSYLGLDTDVQRIDFLNQLIDTTAEDSFKAACRFVARDASDLSWYTTLPEKQKFHAAVFMNPIVEDPYVVAKEYEQDHAQQSADWHREYDAVGKALYAQYISFQTIFHTVLKECLVPDASLLMRTFHRQEYTATLKIFSSLAVGLPENGDAKPGACLALTYKSV